MWKHKGAGRYASRRDPRFELGFEDFEGLKVYSYCPRSLLEMWAVYDVLGRLGLRALTYEEASRMAEARQCDVIYCWDGLFWVYDYRRREAAEMLSPCGAVFPLAFKPVAPEDVEFGIIQTDYGTGVYFKEEVPLDAPILRHLRSYTVRGSGLAASKDSAYWRLKDTADTWIELGRRHYEIRGVDFRVLAGHFTVREILEDADSIRSAPAAFWDLKKEVEEKDDKN